MAAEAVSKLKIDPVIKDALDARRLSYSKYKGNKEISQREMYELAICVFLYAVGAADETKISLYLDSSEQARTRSMFDSILRGERVRPL